MKASFANRRPRRRTVMALVSLAVLLATLLIGVGSAFLKSRWNSYVDMTEEGLYTLTSDFLSEVGKIEDDITITFCADPDVLLENYETRYVYIMAREIEKRMPNVTVKTYDIASNPTAVQEYRTTSSTVISWNHVIVSCDRSYRTLKASAFWSKDSSTGNYFAFNGEYKMATAMLSVTAIDRPVAYFTVGHGERVYDPARPEDAENERQRAFWQLLRDEGLAVDTVCLDEEEIPSDCALLIMNGPTADYASAREDWFLVDSLPALEKIDRYLDGAGSLMVLKDPSVSLPALEEYLSEFGMQFVNGLTVKGGRAEEAPEILRAEYPTEEDSLAHSLFGDVSGLATAPRVVIPRSGHIASSWIESTKFISNHVSAMTSAVFYSSPDTKLYDSEGRLAGEGGGYALARMTARVRTVDTRDYFSYVFCAASTALVETEYLDNPNYANYDTLFSAVRSISRTDKYASDALGGLNINSDKYGGKHLHSDAIGKEDKPVYKDGKVVRVYHGLTPLATVAYTLLVLLPVPCLAVVGTVLCVRRKYR